MSRGGIEQLLFMMDAAFEGGPMIGAAVLPNLESVRDDDWLWLPEGGKRSIYDLVEHLGAKYIYESHAFGDGSMNWAGPGSLPGIGRDMPRADVIEWLREAHRRWRANIEALTDDEELMHRRKAPWGLDTTIRWLVNAMIQHDLYHAGEINHIRALRQGNDE